MPSNIDQIRRILAERDADAVLLTFLPDIRWACGFTGSNGVLLVLPDRAHFLSDGRYEVQARQEVREAEVHTPGYDLFSYLAEANLLGGAGRVLFQADHLTCAQLGALQEKLQGVVWAPGEGLLAQEVASKSPDEVDRIRSAQRITEEVFEHLLGLLRPGLREQEVAAEIVYQHLLRGAERMSFEPIVASGPQGALPHARPTDRVIAPGEMVVLDCGCFYRGYASDMTRTVAVGEPGEEARRVYAVVLEAQERALAAAQAGMSSQDLDAVARAVIEEAGYGSYFSHGLGHGVGLQIHEWPRVSYHVDQRLPDGAVVTIEPGVYLPDRFGVRIEDMVYLTDGGAENLTRASKELLVL